MNHQKAALSNGKSGFLPTACACGEIGRRAVFRRQFRKVWEFESPRAHVFEKASPCGLAFFVLRNEAIFSRLPPTGPKKVYELAKQPSERYRDANSFLVIMNRFTSRLLTLIGLLTVEVLLGAALFVAAFALFFYMSRVVFVHHSLALDDWASGLMDDLRREIPGLTGPVRFVTFFASLPFLLPAGLIAPFLLHRIGHPREAWHLVMAMLGGIILNQLLKGYFDRPRPSNALLQTLGLSFPSGHAMLAVTFYGCLAWLLARHFGRPGWATTLLIWALLIGLTRVYLHAHYATDVLAGFAGGAAWLVACRLGIRLFWKEEKEVMGEDGI